MDTLIILSPGFAKDEQDSGCLPAHQVFVKALNRNFPQLRVIILAFQYPYCSKTYQWFGNTIISFNGGNKKRFHRLFLWFRVYTILKKKAKENNVVGLLSFWATECALVSSLFARKNGLRYFCWITGQDAKRGNSYIKWIKPAPDNLIAMSDFLSDAFVENHGVRPAHVVPNGIDPSMFAASRPTRSIDIMGAGSLIALKQYEVFVEVIMELQKKIPAINACLCGSGPEETKIKERVAFYGLENNISLKGNLSHTDVLKMMQHAKIFLHPSCYEGFSTVCLEALYAGAQVVSFVRPMKNTIPHWHIVHTKEEMVEKVFALLSTADTEYSATLPYRVDDNAIAVMHLFNYR